VIWVTVAILAGVYAAVKRYSLFDSGLTIFNYVGYSLPTSGLESMLKRSLPCRRYDGSQQRHETTSTRRPAFGTSDYWAFFARTRSLRSSTLVAI